MGICKSSVVVPRVLLRRLVHGRSTRRRCLAFGANSAQEKNKQFGIPDAQAEFFIMPCYANPWDLPGLDNEDMDDLLVERWGMEHAMSRVGAAPREGRFWPVAVREGE